MTIRRHLLAGKGHDLKTGSKEQSCLRDKREGSPDTSTLNDAEKIKAQGDKRKKKKAYVPTLRIVSNSRVAINKCIFLRLAKIHCVVRYLIKAKRENELKNMLRACTLIRYYSKAMYYTQF